MCASIHSQFEIGGDSRDRTGDLLLARQALSQLSYIPISALNFLRKISRFAASALQRETSFPLIIPSGLRRDGGIVLFRSLRFPLRLLVGPSGLEPPTLRLSVVRSSQLSYGPISTAPGRMPSKLNNERASCFTRCCKRFRVCASNV